MKNTTFAILAVAIMLNSAGCIEKTDSKQGSDKKMDAWFDGEQWLGGWQVKPDPSIDRGTFTIAYFKNKDRWDKAFQFLSSQDLSQLEPKRYDIDGDNLYASVSEYLTKNIEDAKYEAHRKYADIQYVIRGKEQIGIAPLSEKQNALEPYNDEKDYELFTVKQGTNHRATQESFFIFFPDDAHSPGLKDKENEQVKKIVIKVKLD